MRSGIAFPEAGGPEERRAHVVGAGLAGLSAAVALAGCGWRVALCEAGPAAGGRCRSYFDRALGCRIDNGNHLLLAGNSAAIEYLETTGARATLTGPGRALFPFFDLTNDERWVLAPNPGPLPFWIFCPSRRVPGTRGRDYWALRRFFRASPEATVADMVPDGPLYRRLVVPLSVASLNTRPEQGSARLFGRVLEESLAQGGAACVPLYPRTGLSETFVDPALAWLAGRGAEVRFGRRIAALETADGRIAALVAADGERIAAQPGEAVVLAVPAPIAADLLPGLVVPDAFEAILNLHFRVHVAPGPAGFIALLGGLAEWVFVKPEVVSVTVSAATRLMERPADALAAEIWPEVCRALDLSGVQGEAMPSVRVVKERRATIAATPAEERIRPGARTAFANLALAGDWTATGLPGTIEGAIRSGRIAADIFSR
ncbi:MAG: hydroxysqualene dehydroxylase HpnE [Rhodospirillales bacterium]|nr:hydroxysqualene dehydroxylase HpnE [Rhodospirillales bacterium]